LHMKVRMREAFTVWCSNTTRFSLKLGSKAAITTHGPSIVVISPPFTPTPASHSATVRRSAISAGASSRGEAVKVTVFDLENKLISYSNVFQDGVRDVFGEDGRQFCLWDGRREVR
jgi:hypothetical protein